MCLRTANSGKTTPGFDACRGFIGRAALPPPIRPDGVAGPSTPAGVPTAAGRLVRDPQVEDSLNEWPQRYGGAPQHSHPEDGRPHKPSIGTIKRPAASDSVVGLTRLIIAPYAYAWSLLVSSG